MDVGCKLLGHMQRTTVLASNSEIHDRSDRFNLHSRGCAWAFMKAVPPASALTGLQARSLCICPPERLLSGHALSIMRSRACSYCCSAMGRYCTLMGWPADALDHTGRCDYWGPFVNRAARFANSAARGGQIMVPAAVGHALVAALTKQAISLDGDEPVLLVQPDFVPQRLKLRPSKPWTPQPSGRALRYRHSELHRCTAEVQSNSAL